MLLPILTMVLPSETAMAKSSDIPIESSQKCSAWGKYLSFNNRKIRRSSLNSVRIRVSS